MKNIKLIMASIVAVFMFAIAPAIVGVGTVSAQNPKAEVCKGSGGTWSGNSTTGTCTYTDVGQTDVKVIVKNVVNILLYVIGAVAVIMIVIGGIKYTTSNGDQSQVTSAKNTILYSVIGIVIAFTAYAIVNFVVLNF